MRRTAPILLIFTFYLIVACHNSSDPEIDATRTARYVTHESAESSPRKSGQQHGGGPSQSVSGGTQASGEYDIDGTDRGHRHDSKDGLQEHTEERVLPNLPETALKALPARVQEIPQVTSFQLYQNGEILSEYYRGTMHRNHPVNIKSASKSVLSALIGIAIREGYIESVDDRAARYLPGYFEALDNPEKKNITIRHLLTMSSGLESTSFRNYARWVTSSDWVSHVLQGDLEQSPGSHMNYSTGDTHLLSAVLTGATGMSSRRFAVRNLFGPMGITLGGWDRDPAGYYFGGNNMAVSPAGLLEIGRMYLQGGNYEDRQILPSDWVDTTLTARFRDVSYNYRNHDYGYLWWRNDFAGYEVWFAWGYGGQYLFIIPELNAVTVFTGNPDQRAAGGNNGIYQVLEEDIIPGLFHLEKAGIWPVEKFAKKVAT